MANLTIKKEYIESTAFSGSENLLRNELGIFWEETVATDGTSTTTFNKGVPHIYTEGAGDITPDQILHGSSNVFTSHSERLRYVELQPAFQVTASANKIIPNFKIPGRFYGNENKIRSDSEWKTYLLGGTYGEKTYPGIFSTQVFNDYGISYEKPYDLSTYKELHKINGGGYASASVTYCYAQHIPEFEKWAADTPELLLPSVSHMELLIETSSSMFPIEESITRDGQYPLPLTTILDGTLTTQLPPRYYSVDSSTTPPRYIDLTLNLRDYLKNLVNYPLSDKTIAAIAAKSNNLIYSEGASKILFTDVVGGDAKKVLGNYPMYVDIDFPRSINVEGKFFRDIFKEADFSGDLLSALAAMWNNAERTGSDMKFPYVVRVNKDTISSPTLSEKQIHETESLGSTTLEIYDYLMTLVDDYTDPVFAPLTNFISLIVPGYTIDDEFIKAANDPTPLQRSSRFLRSYSLLTTLTRLVSLLDSEYSTVSENIEEDIVHFNIDLAGKNGIYKLLQKAGTGNYKETIAYRIQKIDSSGAAQNLWFYNELPMGESEDFFQYRDSQVKYGETYTYNVFAYVLATGLRYRMQDLRIGKNIGTGSIGNQSQDKFCLQFHDADSDAIVDQLFASSNEDWAEYTGDEYHGVYNELASQNTFSSNAQTLSEFPYLADFNLLYEPSLQMKQIPIVSKSITILDNPAPGIDVVPFQVIDNSQKIGFYMKAEVYEPAAPFPDIIRASDNTYKDAYLESNDLEEGDKIGLAPISDQAYIQIFRMETKPTGYKDFDGYLYKTLPLDIVGDISRPMQYYVPNQMLYDKIATNKKYYYVMRLLNAHREPGAPSAIIEAELVDDGGYKYALFKELFEEDLAEETFVNPSIPVKKLFRIIPNVRQLILDPTNVDFTQPADTQLTNLKVGDPSLEESIWDQKFKIRLTSKKTGKKIDLNLTFNLSEQA